MHIACEYVISKLLALKTLETRLIANVLGLAIPMKLNDPIVRVLQIFMQEKCNGHISSTKLTFYASRTKLYSNIR